ncbi:hypothetical protein KA057_00570 [Candidatus Gracilibacteria bacterium]|nr:hypothetical protein [Candidatus Gracilibacteria bacterium]
MSIGGPAFIDEDNDALEEAILPNGAFYIPERDGTILEYLSDSEDNRTPRAFKTFKHFLMLIDAGVLEREFAELYSIRVLYNSGRSDEFYTLNDLEFCEGADVNVHRGKPGKHKIRDILMQNDFRWWEISGINPKFLRKTISSTSL